MTAIGSRWCAGLGLWSGLIGFDTFGQLLFKIGSADLAEPEAGWPWLVTALTTPWILGGIGCYLGSFVAWMLILRRTDLSLAFPLSGFGFVTVALASWLILGENIEPLRWLGIGAIIAGVALLGRDA